MSLLLLPYRRNDKVERGLPGAWYGWYHRMLGAVLFAAFVPLLPYAPQLFSASGLFDAELLRVHPRGGGLSIYDFSLLAGRHLGLPASLTVYAFAGSYLGACVALIAGWRVRLAAVALLLLHRIFFMAVPIYNYGFDFLALSALFYCAVYHVRWGMYILRLLQVHLCFVYFFGGLNKAIGATWHNGEALWKAILQPIGEPIIQGMALLPLPWLWTVLGWGVVALELLYAVLVWWRPARPWVLGATVAMHVGIALCLGLYAFSGLMILLNLTAFYFPYLNDSTCLPPEPSEQARRDTGVAATSMVEPPACHTSSTNTAGTSAEKPP